MSLAAKIKDMPVNLADDVEEKTPTEAAASDGSALIDAITSGDGARVEELVKKICAPSGDYDA